MNRRGRMLLPVVALVALAGGCASSGEPDDYDDTVAENFTTSCLEANGDLPDSVSQQSPEDYCGCIYDFFVANVAYDTFKDLDDDLENGINDERYQNLDDLDGVPIVLADGVSVDDRTNVSFGSLIEGCLAGDPPTVVDTSESSDSSDESTDESSDNSDESSDRSDRSDDAVTDDASDPAEETTTTEA